MKRNAVQVVLALALAASTVSAGVNVWTTNGPNGEQIRALAIDPANPATIYAGALGGVFKSTDGGGIWTAVNTGLTSTDVRGLAIDPVDPATLYAGTSDGAFKSTNGGGSWTDINTGLTSTDVRAVLAIGPGNPATVYVGTSGAGVFKSANGGGSWTAMNTGLTSTDVRVLTINRWSPTMLYAGTSGGVFGNNGVSWTAINAGLTNTSVYALAIDPGGYWDDYGDETLYAGTSYGVFKSTNSGRSWTAIDTGLTNTVVQALAIPYPSSGAGPDTAYAGTEGGVFKIATNGGGSWTAINTGLTSTDVRALAIDPANLATLYAGTAGGGVFKSTNGGGSWTAINGGLLGEACVSDSTTLCLSGGRFKVTTRWTTAAGQSGSGQAVALAGGNTGYFTFFDPTDVEILVKVLNGCGFNGRFWTFAGGLTDVEVVMTVLDSQTGVVKIYRNSQGTPFEPIQDTDAFVACGTGGAATRAEEAAVSTPAPLSPFLAAAPSGVSEVCVTNATTLCLNSARYEVRARWFTLDGASGLGQALPLTGDTGAFWFFSPNSVEIVIKVLNGCDDNSRYWTFAAGLTNVNVILTVTDTKTGAIQTYVNPQGTPFPPIQDTNAFATCP